MTIAALVPVVREALGVSSSYDATSIPAGIRRAIVFMLRSWSFPQALVTANYAIALNGNSVSLPVSGVGKIHTVRMKDASGELTKRLRRTLIGESAVYVGPEYYWQEGNKIVLDTKVTEAGYSIDVWYNSINVDAADAWITSDFEDIVFTLSVMRLAQDMRKPEVQQAFASTWQEQIPTLAQYLNEVEFNDMDIRMKPSVNPTPVDRYGN
jgi:hypothetical protein